MKSIKELYRIGTGPSSSHTMAPRRAAEQFLARHPEAAAFRVTLYGSLAATGRGHMTDRAIIDTLLPTAPVDIVWQAREFLPFHPNGMRFQALDTAGTPTDTWTVYSIGGGELAEEGVPPRQAEEIYEMNTLDEILAWCRRTAAPIGNMSRSASRTTSGTTWPKSGRRCAKASSGGSTTKASCPVRCTSRAAPRPTMCALRATSRAFNRAVWVFAYALAVAEENASGGRIVTAPTCGSSGVVPAVLYHLQKSRGFSDARIYRALATAGLFGNVVKHNASISGAEVGCQGEVGVACAMAAAAANQLFGGSPSQIEYAAEMGLEHHLGMTCDPVCGLVQIPCIERNAYAAARALDANLYSAFTDGGHRVSFDRVVEVMKQTGHDLPSIYKETGEGGLAREYDPDK